MYIMQINIILFGILAMSFAMVAAKRMVSLIRGFRVQSALLFLVTFFFALESRELELFAVAALLFILKVVMIPRFLSRVVKRIKVDENLGFFVNPLLSLCITLLLTYLSYLFTSRIMLMHENIQGFSFAVSLSVTLTGMFIMVFRIKAITQIVGLMVMENGLFLAASAVSGGMPFFVEIAIFFDVFICVMILGVFVYKINRLFTHIDVNKLKQLKG